MSGSEVVVTPELISDLMDELGNTVPDDLHRLFDLIPADRAVEARRLYLEATKQTIETSFHAGSLGSIAAGLKDDGSSELSDAAVAGIVAEAVRFLIKCKE